MYFDNNISSPPKKRHHQSFDSDIPPLGLPRKKFISEESFAKDMAAMSLDTTTTNTSQQQTQQSFADEDTEEDESNSYMTLDDTNGKPLIDIDANGLPMELRPGENKPRIPQFVLENPELLDPRDKLAYQKLMKTLYNKQKHIEIEVLNSPSTHYTPTSMDID